MIIGKKIQRVAKSTSKNGAPIPVRSKIMWHTGDLYVANKQLKIVSFSFNMLDIIVKTGLSKGEVGPLQPPPPPNHLEMQTFFCFSIFHHTPPLEVKTFFSLFFFCLSAFLAATLLGNEDLLLFCFDFCFCPLFKKLTGL